MATLLEIISTHKLSTVESAALIVEISAVAQGTLMTPAQFVEGLNPDGELVAYMVKEAKADAEIRGTQILDNLMILAR